LEPEFTDLLAADFAGLRTLGPSVPLWQQLPLVLMCRRFPLFFCLAIEHRRE
jgi:hypothetical protein